MASVAVVAGCSTTGKTIQTATEVSRPRAREVHGAKGQPVELDLTALFVADRAGRKITLNRGELQWLPRTGGKAGLQSRCAPAGRTDKVRARSGSDTE